MVLVFMMTEVPAWASGGKVPQGEVVQVETLTVTAEKRKADEQQVPISMDAFDAMALEDAGIDNTPDLIRLVPNVYFKQATMENIMVVRGVSSVDGATIGPVGVYIDGINYPLQFMHNLEFLDVERVEFLRGPQGTLYGRNTESGVLNIVTREPSNQVGGMVKATCGMYDTSHGTVPEYQVGVGLDIPVVKDRFFIGIDAQGIKSDGFMKNTRTGDEDAARTDRRNIKADVLWLPSDRLSVLLTADVFEYDDGQGLYRIFTSDDGLKNDNPTEMRGFYDSTLDQEGSGQALKVEYEADAFDLVSVTGHRAYDQYSCLGSGVGVENYGKNTWDFDDRFLSQEVRISSKESSGPFEWLLGVYGFNEKTDIDFSKFDGMQVRQTQVEKNGAAAFVNATYTFFNRLHLTGGMRYDYVDLEGSQNLAGYDWSYNDISADYSKDLDFGQWLPKVVLSCDVNSNAMAYASVAKGYLEGGYNYAQATDRASFVYDPEYTWNYEVGVKTDWFEKRLIANASLYYISMKDKQISQYTAGGAIASISNAAKAHSKGIELELQAKPAKGWDVFATFGYIDAEIDEWDSTTTDFSGNKMPNTPDYTYSLGTQYRHKSGFFGRVDFLGTGEMYGNVQNDDHVKFGDYCLVNLRIGYEAEKYDVILWCKNAFDEAYYTSTFDYGASEPIGVAQNGDPRMFGITVTYRF